MEESWVESLSDEHLVTAWADTMSELRRRQIVRSSNNPVADIAESLAARELKLVLAGPSTRGYDATDDQGRRYQIKSRRITAHNKSRQLSFLRNLADGDFDILLDLIFDERLRLLEMWEVPHHVIDRYARWSRHANARILTMRGPVLEDPAVRRVR